MFQPPRDDERDEDLERCRQFLANPARNWINDYLQYAEDLGFDRNEPDIMRRATIAGERAHGKAQSGTYRDPRRHEPIVYYMARGDLVKIGTSVNIAVRLEALRPERLLAVEMGGRQIEAARHRQFAADRNHGEWFRVTPELAAHMSTVRAEFEDLVGLTLDAWLAERSRPLRQPTSPASTLAHSPAGQGPTASSPYGDNASVDPP
jgi:hypothetical protein